MFDGSGIWEVVGGRGPHDLLTKFSAFLTVFLKTQAMRQRRKAQTYFGGLCGLWEGREGIWRALTRCAPGYPALEHVSGSVCQACL